MTQPINPHTIILCTTGRLGASRQLRVGSGASGPSEPILQDPRELGEDALPVCATVSGACCGDALPWVRVQSCHTLAQS